MTTQTFPHPGSTYAPDHRWEQRVTELKNFHALHHRLPVRADRTSEQGPEHSLASWLHVQQLAFRRGNLSAMRRNILEHIHPLALGSVPSPLIRPMPILEPKLTGKSAKKVRVRGPKKPAETRTVQPVQRKPRKGWLRPETAWDTDWLAKFDSTVKALDGADDPQRTDQAYLDATKWLTTQRVKHRQHPFAPWRLALLEQHFPGRVTAPARSKAHWEDNLRDVATYINQNGALPSSKFSPHGARLYAWVNNQARRSIAGRLNQADRARLDAVLNLCSA